MIVNKAWNDIQHRPNVITTSYSMYYIEQGVKIERMNNGKVVILDTTSFGDNFRKITQEQQYMFDEFGFRAGQLAVLIKGLTAKVSSLERTDTETETVSELKKNIFDFKVELEEIIHTFAIPKSETGIFSQKNNL